MTPGVLETLTKYNIHATFFVLGKRVATPEGTALAKRERAEGHWIGNHSYTHSVPLGRLDAAKALAEVERTEKALEWLDQRPKLFRPYGGGGKLNPELLHPAVVRKLVADGYTCVLWNSVPRDWIAPHSWLERAISDCRSREWSLVVLHDHLANGAPGYIEEFIVRLRGEGFEFVQEFPPECTPIVNGKIVLPIDAYVTGEPELQL